MKFSAKNTLARFISVVCFMGQFLYGSTQNCPNEEKSLDFRVSHAQLDEVTFEWQHPRCIENNYEIDYYNIAIIGPDGKLYQSNVGKVTGYTVKRENQRETGLQLENMPITPCFQYEVILGGFESYWSGSTKVVEESLFFVVPLVPGDIQQMVRASTGPGWVALIWNMGKACYEPNYAGYRLHSFKLRISGGRQQEEQSFELSMGKDGRWFSPLSQFVFNLTNDKKDCGKVWCWQPCTDYSLDVSGITLDQNGVLSTTNIRKELRINTPIEKLEKDAAPQDLALVDRGADWLYLRWKRPYCLQNSSNLYRLNQIQSNNKIKVCAESISWKDLRNDTENMYHFYNMTSLCGQKLKPCTEYKFRIRGEYSDQIEGGHRKSNDLVATTLPPSVKDLKLIPKPRSPLNLLQLSWSRAPNCSKKPIQKYHLLLKVHSIPEITITQEFRSNCGGVSVCEIEFESLPCTIYEAEVRPIYANISEAIPPTVASLTTSFPAPGENYSIISDSAGSSWASLSLKLPPQCLRFVENFNLKFYAEDSRNGEITARVSNECFRVNNENGTIRFNVTESSCFPNFNNIKTCTGRYEVEVLPEVPAGLMGTRREALQTSFQLINPDLTSIENVTITERGESWISLNWTSPLCTQHLRPSSPYLISMFNATSEHPHCYFDSTATQTYTNATSRTLCINTRKYLEIQSCTEYYFEVKADFTPQDLNVKVKPTRSNVVRTLPNPSQTHVENLAVSKVRNTHALFSWQPPICAHFTTRYQLELQDFSQGGATVVSATIPTACLDASNQLEWPPTTDCGIHINQGQNPNALEPCTDYKLIVWPRIETDKGSRNGSQRETAFTTKSASPGKVRSLHVTANTETTILILWESVIQNARCLQSYEVSVKDKAGKELNDKFPVNRNSYTFANLKLCSTYQVTVRSVGKPGDEVLAEIREFSTPESQPGPPENLNYSTLPPNSVNLTWDEPNVNPACVGDYLINIFEVESNKTKMVFKNITTKSRYMVMSTLKPGTKYECHVKTRTKSKTWHSSPIKLIITTPPGTASMSDTFMGLLITGCIAALIFLVCLFYLRTRFRFCCRNKQNSYNSVCDDPKRNTVNDCSEVAGTAGSTCTTQEQATPPRDSVYAYIKNRPIPRRSFEQSLKKLVANNCALLNAEFEDVKLFSNDCEPEPIALDEPDKAKNRFPDILPFEHSRVKLYTTGGQSDYINASYTHGFNREREYIATQNPLPNTLLDFWRMVWDQGIRVIVMLARMEESDQAHCAKYWPDEDQTVAFGGIRVSHDSESEEDGYFVRDLNVVEGNSSKRLIKQMHFWQFTKFGCPESPANFLAFVKAVRDQVALWSTAAPLLVHCSAGLGRTGAFIAVDWLTQAAVSKSHLDVFNTVITLRLDRMNMVQTEYLFIHECVDQFLKSLPNGTPSQTYCEGNEGRDNERVYANLPAVYNSSEDAVKLPLFESEYEIPNM